MGVSVAASIATYTHTSIFKMTTTTETSTRANFFETPNKLLNCPENSDSAFSATDTDNEAVLSCSDDVFTDSDCCSLKKVTATRPPSPSPLNPQVHLLHTTWNLYYSDRRQGEESKNFSSDLTLIQKVSTIETFWQAVNHIHLPTQLKYKENSNYFFFRDGIQPEWEHPENSGGGMLRVILKSRDRSTFLDEFWLEMLMALVGECFECSNEVTGVVLQRRHKEDRVCLWLKDCDEEAICDIRFEMSCLLGLEGKNRVHYLKHDKSVDFGKRRNSSVL